MDVLEIDILKCNFAIIAPCGKGGVITGVFRYAAKTSHRVCLAVLAPNDDCTAYPVKNKRTELLIALLLRFVIATEVDIRRQEEAPKRKLFIVKKLPHGFVNTRFILILIAHPRSSTCFAFGRLIVRLLLRQLQVVFAIVPGTL